MTTSSDSPSRTWWKKRTNLERQLVLFIGFICIIVLGLSIALGILKSKDPSKQLCLTPECVKAASTMLKYINKSIDPCDNFYDFACGGYLQSTVIPEDEAVQSQFTIIEDKLTEQLKSVMQEEIKPNEPRAFKLVKKFYKVCMNKTLAEETGLATMKDYLREFGGWPVVDGSSWNERDFDWKKTEYKLRHLGFEYGYLFDLEMSPDAKNTSNYMIKIDQPGLSLARKTILKGMKDTVVQAYFNFMVDIAVAFGAEKTRALRELKDTLEFEIKLANITIPSEERRNITLEHNPMTVATLQRNYPSIPWLKMINMFLAPIEKLEEDEIISVAVPKFVKALEELIRKTPKRVLANYLSWRAVQDSVSYLNAKVRDIEMELYTALHGMSYRSPRWKECIDEVSRLDIAVGAMYIRKFFKPESQKLVSEMVDDIKREFLDILKNTEWIDKETKDKALNKASAMGAQIGYPSELMDDKKIDNFYKGLEIDTTDFLKADLNITLFAHNTYLKKFRQKVNKTDWTMHSEVSIVNAQYSFYDNNMELPAGILQGIMFNKDRPQYMNYAGIGFVIGHELTHGFDDQGRQFDKDGTLVDWWTEETDEAYREKAQCIVDQYSNYTMPEINENLNGINTQGENIADNGALKLSYLAYKRWSKRNGKEKRLPGLDYTSDQLFWIAMANTWCSKVRKEVARNQVANGYHSPDRFRIIGPYRNSRLFAKDFGCPVGSKMNPKEKCSVW